MASRQEEKEARRREREAQEEAERRAAARNRRLQMVLGGVLALLVIGGAIFAITQSGGGDSEGEGPQAVSDQNLPTLPEPEETDLDAAVKAAGCKLNNAENEGGGHEDKQYTAADYQTNPPSSGQHTNDVAQDGIYDEGPPELGLSVHALEHGRINVQYKPGASKQRVDQLKALLAETGGYHMLLFENQTDMDAEVSATAWTHVLTCPTVNDKTWDAMRTFRDRYIDQGPESVP
jgi:hypothetical protein